MVDETNFPRGGGVQHQNDDGKKNEGHGEKSNRKKRYTSDDSNAIDGKKVRRSKSISSTDGLVERDFLFGGSKDDNNKRKISRESKSSSKNQEESNSSTSVGALIASLTAKSMLPIGGGGVVLPRQFKEKADLKLTKTKNSNARESMRKKRRNEGYIEPLSFSKLTKGTKLLGVVREIYPDVIIFSLPNMWTGYMLRKDVTDHPTLETVVQVHQIISVVIVSAEVQNLCDHDGVKSKKGKMNHHRKLSKRKMIEVSCSPDAINNPSSYDLWNKIPNFIVRGQVLSIEDNGLLVQLGYGRRGFLSYDDIDGPYSVDADDNDDDDEDSKPEEEVYVDEKNNNIMSHPTLMKKRMLNVNRILDFIVKFDEKNTSFSNDTFVKLQLPSLHKMAAIQSMTPTGNNSSNKLRLLDVQPGMLVRVYVEMTVSNGLCVSFGAGAYRGSIEYMHFHNYWIPSNTGVDTSALQQDDKWKPYYSDPKLSQAKLLARVIVIDPVTKIIRLSFRPHLLEMNVSKLFCGEGPQGTLPLSLADAQLPNVGTVFNSCKVLSIDSGIGVLLALNNAKPENEIRDNDDDHMEINSRSEKLAKDVNATNHVVYVHISKVSDQEYNKSSNDNDDDILAGEKFLWNFFNRYEKQSDHQSDHPHQPRQPLTHMVRITGSTNLIEGISTGATASKIVNAHVLSHDDIAPGNLYKQVPVCKVMEHTGSVLVDFGLGVKGLLSKFHMFDSNSSVASAKNDNRIKLMKQRFSIGAKVDVRVLHVDPRSKRCYVTAKKGLVMNGITALSIAGMDDDGSAHNVSTNKKTSLLTSYETVQIGQVCCGFVTKVDNNAGLWITFYNRVYGRVTVPSLRKELGIDVLTDNFSVGDVVECRVINIQNKRNGRLEKNYPDDKDNGDDYEDDDAMQYDDVNDSHSTGNDAASVDGSCNTDTLGDSSVLSSTPSSSYSRTSTSTRKRMKQITLSLKVDGPIELFEDIETNKDGSVTGKASVTSETTGTGLGATVSIASTKRIHLHSGSIIPPSTMRVSELVLGATVQKDKRFRREKGGGDRHDNDQSVFVAGYAIVTIKAKHIFNPHHHTENNVNDDDDDNENSSARTVECKIPFDQLQDSYEAKHTQSVEALDAYAKTILQVGKVINSKGIILCDPKKSPLEYIAGTGRLIIISLRPQFIQFCEQGHGQVLNENKNSSTEKEAIIVPDPTTRFYKGMCVVGYVNQIHKKHGAFVRFLNGLSGLVPRKFATAESSGMTLYSTMTFHVTAFDDSQNPPKITLLPKVNKKGKQIKPKAVLV